MASGVALQVAQPDINSVGYFNASQQQAQQQKAMALEQKKQGLQGIYMMSAGLLRGNLDGQADPNEWEQAIDMMAQQGADPALLESLRGRPEMANVMARGSAEALRYSLDERQLDAALKKLELEMKQAAAGPSPIVINDQLVNPGNAQVLGDFRDPAEPAPKPMTAEERRMWGIPETDQNPYFINSAGEPELVGGRPLVEIGNGDPFGDTLAGAEAKMFAGFIEQGPTAARTLAQLGQLEALLENVDTGGGAAFVQMAGELGINIEGLSEIQAAQALINQMVPAQRPPGSGPMSDADLALFKQSVPRLINQPGGNQLIIDTMRAINEYDLKLAQIAQQAASGDLDRAAARAAVNAIQNPLDGFGKRASAIAKSGSSDSGQTFTTPNGIEYSF